MPYAPPIKISYDGTESKPENQGTESSEECYQGRKSFVYKFQRKYPVQFRRQYILGNYLVDFYCHKAKLVVELDGSQHCEPEKIRYDRERTAYLESLGLYVLRLSNLDILRQFESVCNAIDRAVNARTAAI